MARILLVDDDPLIRRSVRILLEEGGHEITEAEDGDKALSALDRAGFDLMILDLIMPEREGLETIMAIRRAGNPIPILAISGGGRSQLLEFLPVAEKLGANLSLRKPFTNAQLEQAIGSLLSV